MRPRNIRKLAGKTILNLYDEDMNDTMVAVEVPNTSQILTFQVGDWLVLDPYGTDIDPLLKRVLNHGKRAAVAIHTKTGVIGHAHYFEDDGIHSIQVTPYKPGDKPYKLPEWTPMMRGFMLDKLVGKKRPYSVHLLPNGPQGLTDYIDRGCGYMDLADSVVFSFDFMDEDYPHYLEVCGDQHRETGPWRDV